MPWPAILRTSLEEQQAAWRAEWEARDPTAEASWIGYWSRPFCLRTFSDLVEVADPKYVTATMKVA